MIDNLVEQPLQRAIKIAGGQKALAVLISTPDDKVSQQVISYWLKHRSGLVPPEMAPRIEKAVGVTKQELRPDVF